MFHDCPHLLTKQGTQKTQLKIMDLIILPGHMQRMSILLDWIAMCFSQFIFYSLLSSCWIHFGLHHDYFMITGLSFWVMRSIWGRWPSSAGKSQTGTRGAIAHPVMCRGCWTYMVMRHVLICVQSCIIIYIYIIIYNMYIYIYVRIYIYMYNIIS